MTSYLMEAKMLLIVKRWPKGRCYRSIYNLGALLQKRVKIVNICPVVLDIDRGTQKDIESMRGEGFDVKETSCLG